MDSRDAHHRHTLRGALIHFNAHTEKQPDADAQESVKKGEFPPKASPYFHAIASTLSRSASVRGKKRTS